MLDYFIKIIECILGTKYAIEAVKGVSFDTIMILWEKLSLPTTLHFRNLSNCFIIMVIQNDFMLQKKQWHQS